MNAQLFEAIHKIRQRQQHLEHEPEEPDYFEAERSRGDFICGGRSLTVEQRQELKAQFQKSGRKS